MLHGQEQSLRQSSKSTCAATSWCALARICVQGAPGEVDKMRLPPALGRRLSHNMAMWQMLPMPLVVSAKLAAFQASEPSSFWRRMCGATCQKQGNRATAFRMHSPADSPFRHRTEVLHVQRWPGDARCRAFWRYQQNDDDVLVWFHDVQCDSLADV